MPEAQDDTELWPRAKALFLELAEAGEETQRLALGRLAASEPALGAFVARLLEQDRVDTAGGAGAATRIGPYTVLEKLGEGGFGAVYRARQEEPIVRDVALKVQKAGLHSPELVARFADERRYLARIDHPDVVKVLDAGVTDDGRLYIAMELVRGEPITEFVAREAPTLNERVALLARVARAVHHVHQRAILHRDLKPTNILVSRVDGELRPRLIDFGIATARSNADRRGWTRLMGPMCTPGYAAPEQLAGGENVDVRADVHALGCVLCECLTGARPYSNDARGETPPTAPSALAQRTQGLRRSAPLPASVLRGELDLVVLKAVAKDPEDRYDSAAALAADLERFLGDEPVLAAPPSIWYAARKFTRRNRASVGLAALSLALVFGAAGVALEGRRRALVEREVALDARDLADQAAARARTVTTYLLEDMVAQLDIDARPERAMTHGELLEAAERDAAVRYQDDAATRGAVLALIGSSYAKATRYDDAARALGAALEACRSAYGVPSVEVFELRLALLDLQQTSGRPDAEKHYDAAESEAKALYPPDHLAHLRVRQRGTGDPDELAEIVAVYEARGERGSADHVTALRLLTELLRFAERYDEQIATLRDLRGLLLGSLGPDHSATIDATGSLGRALFRADQHHEGLGLLFDTHGRATRALGPDHNTTRLAARNLADALGDVGRAAEGVPIARDECERTARASGEGSIPHTGSLGYLGKLLARAGQLDEAVTVQRRVLALREAQWTPSHAMRLLAMQDLAETLLARGELDEALTLAETAEARAEVGGWRALQIVVVRAKVLTALGRINDARDALEAAVAAGVAAGRNARDLAAPRGALATLGPGAGER